MAIHSKTSIKNLSSQLDERMVKLKEIITGRELESPYETGNLENPEKCSFVNPSDVRIAVDDFNTILKEIKRVLK